MITDILEMTRKESWMAQSLCSQTDPEIFYPDREDGSHEAIRVCRNCPVQMKCLRWSFRVDDRFGVLGGKTARQRSVIRNRIRRRNA